MRENFTYIELGGENYPIKCDLAVLEAAQEEYGKLSVFEKEIGGLMDSGKKDEDGSTIYIKEEPSMKAVRFVLPLMINEGIDIENRLDGTSRKHLTDETLQESVCGTNVFTLADTLYREFLKCFESKNRNSTQEEEKSGR